MLYTHTFVTPQLSSCAIVASTIMSPKKVVIAKIQPKAKAVKARRIITVDADGGGGVTPLPLRAAMMAKQRRLKKPLDDLYKKVAEKSTVDISQAWVEKGPFKKALNG